MKKACYNKSFPKSPMERTEWSRRTANPDRHRERHTQKEYVRLAPTLPIYLLDPGRFLRCSHDQLSYSCVLEPSLIRVVNCKRALRTTTSLESMNSRSQKDYIERVSNIGRKRRTNEQAKPLMCRNLPRRRHTDAGLPLALTASRQSSCPYPCWNDWFVEVCWRSLQLTAWG